MVTLDGSPTSASQERRSGLPVLVIVAGVLAGVILRAWLLAGPLGAMDSDESVSALVSTEILNGRFSAFIPNLRHGGTILAYPRAPFIALLGRDPVVAKGVEVAAFALGCVVVWRIGRRLFDDRVGQLAGLLLWVFSPAAVWESTKVMLYYVPSMVFSSLAVLVCIRIYQDQRPSDFAWLGLLCGLALWSHPIALYVVVPAVAWLAVTRHRLLVHTWRAVPAAVLGALPWLWFNVRTSFSSLDQPGGQTPSSYGDRLYGFFESLLPRALGLRDQFGGDWYVQPLTWFAYALALVGVAVAVARWRDERTVLLTVGITFPFLFAVPTASIYSIEPRYAMTLLPMLVLGIAYAANQLPWLTVIPPLTLGLAALVSVVSLQYVIDSTSDANVVLRSPPTEEVWQYLDDRGVDTVYADYWLAYRLVWEDRRDVTVLPIYSDYFELTKAHPEGADVALFYRSNDWADRWIQQFGQSRTITTPSYRIVEMPRAIPVNSPGLSPIP